MLRMLPLLLFHRRLRLRLLLQNPPALLRLRERFPQNQLRRLPELPRSLPRRLLQSRIQWRRFRSTTNWCSI